MKCQKCNHDNPDTNKFCSECGAKLEKESNTIECPNCHHQIPVDSKFCPDCGEKLSNQKSKDFKDDIDNGSSKASNIKEFTVKGLSFNMIRVSGGTFVMGATKDEFKPPLYQMGPRHKVTLNSYFIGEAPVTEKLWKAIMGEPYWYKDDSDMPVVKVSWYDCQEFIERLNQKTGMKFRLPTEAEWEFAARGGNKSKHYIYSGSNNLDEVAWYRNNSGGKIHPVKKKMANELGIYDMSGNVYEWCQDWYYTSYYAISPEKDPSGPECGSERVVRGGEHLSDAGVCVLSFRWHFYPDAKYHYRDNNYTGLDEDLYVGFRLALSE